MKKRTFWLELTGLEFLNILVPSELLVVVEVDGVSSASLVSSRLVTTDTIFFTLHIFWLLERVDNSGINGTLCWFECVSNTGHLFVVWAVAGTLMMALALTLLAVDDIDPTAIMVFNANLLLFRLIGTSQFDSSNDFNLTRCLTINCCTTDSIVSTEDISHWSFDSLSVSLKTVNFLFPNKKNSKINFKIR